MVNKPLCKEPPAVAASGIDLFAAGLEAGYGVAERPRHLACHAQQQVKVVWHHRAEYRHDFGREVADAPEVREDRLPKRAQGDSRLDFVGPWLRLPRLCDRKPLSVAENLDLAEKVRPPVGADYGHDVDARLAVVPAEEPPPHVRLKFAASLGSHGAGLPQGRPCGLALAQGLPCTGGASSGATTHCASAACAGGLPCARGANRQPLPCRSMASKRHLMLIVRPFSGTVSTMRFTTDVASSPSPTVSLTYCRP